MSPKVSQWPSRAELDRRAKEQEQKRREARQERRRNSAATKHTEQIPSNDTAQGVAFCPICQVRLYFGTNGDGDLVALDWATGKPHSHQEAVRHNIGTEKQSIE